jgi:hypothetical protein
MLGTAALREQCKATPSKVHALLSSSANLGCAQCGISKVANGTWTFLDTTGSCATNLTSPDIQTLKLIPPGAGEKFYATNSSQC